MSNNSLNATGSLLFFKYSSPYIEKENTRLRDCTRESLRSLNIDSDMFLQMVNVIEIPFKVHFLQKELSDTSQLSI